MNSVPLFGHTCLIFDLLQMESGIADLVAEDRRSAGNDCVQITFLIENTHQVLFATSLYCKQQQLIWSSVFNIW